MHTIIYILLAYLESCPISMLSSRSNRRLNEQIVGEADAQTMTGAPFRRFPSRSVVPPFCRSVQFPYALRKRSHTSASRGGLCLLFLHRSTATTTNTNKAIPHGQTICTYEKPRPRFYNFKACTAHERKVSILLKPHLYTPPRHFLTSKIDRKIDVSINQICWMPSYII